MKLLPFVVVIFLFCAGCKTTGIQLQKYTGEQLIIRQLSKHSFVHVSYLESEQFGKVSCNGMIVMDKGEAIVYDTPADDATSRQLIDWIEQKAKCKIIAVVPTHFHIDCLGGLQAFHESGIPSYANQMTIDLAGAGAAVIPQNGFEKEKQLKVGDLTIINKHIGEGHTADNIIAYVPVDSVLFGGCLVKSLNAGKGNLADANVAAWPVTIGKIKAQFPNCQTVIPGHGKVGDTKLLDFTAQLFGMD